MGFLLLLIGGCASATFLGTTLYYRSRWVRACAALDALRDRQAAPSARPDESLQRAVEAMAIEVERVSESQRFIAKLLAANVGPAPQPNQARTDRQLRDRTPAP